MPSNKQPSVVSPGSGKLASGQVTASSLTFSFNSGLGETYASRVRVETVTFSGALTYVGGGGLTSSATTTQTALNQIDDLLAARRSVTATLQANSSSTRMADIMGPTGLETATNLVTTSQGGRFFVSSVDNSEFTPSASLTNPIHWIGERSSSSDYSGKVRVAFSSTGAAAQLAGSWESFHFRSDHASGFIALGVSGGAPSKLVRCGVESGDLRITTSTLNTLGPTVLDECVVDSSFTGAAGGMAYAALQVQDTGGAEISNSYIRGPHPSSSGTGSIPGTLGILDGLVGETDASRPVVIRNTVIQAQHISVPALAHASTRPVIYENCTFIGLTGQTVPVISCTGGTIHLRSCRIFAKEIEAIFIQACVGSMEDCTVWTGTGTAISDPVSVTVDAANNGRFTIRNLTVNVEAVRASVVAEPRALVQLGRNYDNASAVGSVVADGVKIRYSSGVSNVHAAATFSFVGNYPHGSLSNLLVDFNAANITQDVQFKIRSAFTLENTLVSLCGFQSSNIKVSGVSIVNVPAPTGGTPNSTNVVLVDRFKGQVDDIHVGFRSGALSSNAATSLGSMIELRADLAAGESYGGGLGLVTTSGTGYVGWTKGMIHVSSGPAYINKVILKAGVYGAQTPSVIRFSDVSTTNFATLRSGEMDLSNANVSGLPTVVHIVQSNTLVQELKVTNLPAATRFVTGTSAAKGAAVLNCHAIRASDGSARFVQLEGLKCKVLGNTFEDAGGGIDDVINCTGNATLVANNIVDGTVTTPVITNSGSDSVTANNILV